MIDYFRFEVIPESAGGYLFSSAFPYGGSPMIRMEVSYRGKRSHVTIPAYNDETMLTESFLEQMIRRAVEAFKEQAGGEARKKTQAEIDQARERAVKEIDALARKAKSRYAA